MQELMNQGGKTGRKEWELPVVGDLIVLFYRMQHIPVLARKPLDVLQPVFGVINHL